jgi:hypothetical protein
MATEKTIRLPLEYAQKTLNYLGLRHTKRDLPDGKGVQLRIAGDALSGVSVNVYHRTHSVVVQPYDSPEAKFVSTALRLRSLRLKSKGKIS